jgi:hypothetical protein
VPTGLHGLLQAQGRQVAMAQDSPLGNRGLLDLQVAAYLQQELQRQVNNAVMSTAMPLYSKAAVPAAGLNVADLASYLALSPNGNQLSLPPAGMNTKLVHLEQGTDDTLLPRLQGFETVAQRPQPTYSHANLAHTLAAMQDLQVQHGTANVTTVPTKNASHRKAPAHEAKKTSLSKPATPEEEGSSDDSTETSSTHADSRGAPCLRKRTGRRSQWSAEEHQRFLAGLARFGHKDTGACEPGARISVGLGPGVAEVIAVVVGTRTVSQVRSHAQKYFLRQIRRSVPL